MDPASISHGQVTRLLLQHRTSLYGFILACVHNHADAEDIFQNVCIAVTESIEQLTDPMGFLPWAREIARRRILAHHRTAKRVCVLDPETIQRLVEAAAEVDKERDASAHRAALMECLESLAPQHRRLIVMRYDGASDAQAVAETVGRSIHGVYALMKRIKQNLRECVEQKLKAEGMA